MVIADCSLVCSRVVVEFINIELCVCVCVSELNNNNVNGRFALPWGRSFNNEEVDIGGQLSQLEIQYADGADWAGFMGDRRGYRSGT